MCLLVYLNVLFFFLFAFIVFDAFSTRFRYISCFFTVFSPDKFFLAHRALFFITLKKNLVCRFETAIYRCLSNICAFLKIGFLTFNTTKFKIFKRKYVFIPFYNSIFFSVASKIYTIRFMYKKCLI